MAKTPKKSPGHRRVTKEECDKYTAKSMIKRPKSAYIYFSKEMQKKKEFENVAVTDRAKEIGKRWKKLSDSAKQKYEAMAAKDKKRYEKDLAQHEKDYPTKKRKASAYDTFRKKQWAKYKGDLAGLSAEKRAAKFKKITQAISSAWREKQAPADYGGKSYGDEDMGKKKKRVRKVTKEEKTWDDESDYSGDDIVDEDMGSKRRKKTKRM